MGVNHGEAATVDGVRAQRAPGHRGFFIKIELLV